MAADNSLHNYYSDKGIFMNYKPRLAWVCGVEHDTGRYIPTRVKVKEAKTNGWPYWYTYDNCLKYCEQRNQWI